MIAVQVVVKKPVKTHALLHAIQIAQAPVAIPVMVAV